MPPTKPHRPPRPAYTGYDRRLAIAIDVGTTYSGAAYCIYDRGTVPQIRTVNKYDGQTKAGDAKVPTVLYYDKTGELCGAGAERRFKSKKSISEEDVVKVEWFKVHMRPKTLRDGDEEYQVQDLPFGKTVVQVFGDFIQYIFGCIKRYIINGHSNGQTLFDSFEDRIDFILTHPNGYGVKEQSLMRKAAVTGGLVPDDKTALQRVKLVTEGEASLHYCLESGMTDEALRTGDAVMIVDAGGGTVDISSYCQNGDNFEEVAPAECLYNGSVFVTRRCEEFVKKRLGATKYAEDIPGIVEEFDTGVKIIFNDSTEDYDVPFGGVKENDPSPDIKRGKLLLQGSDIETFFEPPIRLISEAIHAQLAVAKKKIMSMFLVGGFAGSPWLFEKLSEKFRGIGLDVCRPDGHVNKAVADGALAFHLDHRVSSRISKYTYGTDISVSFRSYDPDHVKRESRKTISPIDGSSWLSSGFSVILPRNTQVSETREFAESYRCGGTDISSTSFRKQSVIIFCYRGKETSPKWMDAESGEADMYHELCTIDCDLGSLCDTLSPQMISGKTYYELNFKVALQFGLTEFKAQVLWTENGSEKRSDAAIVPGD